MSSFEGFTPQALQFFLDLRFHNDKTWFDAHKDIYETAVKEPMERLHEALLPMIEKIDPGLDLRAQRVISRIYRDARYARGTPYRDHMWMSYKPIGKSNSDAFTYFFYLTPDEWGYGAGFYEYVPEMIRTFRDRLKVDGEEFLLALKGLGMEQFRVYGESQKRSAKIDLPEELAAWYNKRTFGFECVRPIGPEVYTRDLADILKHGFLALEPVYHYVTGTNGSQPFRDTNIS